MVRCSVLVFAISLAAALVSACGVTPAMGSAPTQASAPGSLPNTPVTTRPATAEPPATSAAPMDYAALVTALKSAGWPVEEDDPASSSIFTGDGHAIRINGVEVRVYEYPTVAALETQAGLISPDGGTVGGPNDTAIIDWADMPHFFKSGRVLAVYVGRAEGTLSALKGVLGAQFAGGTREAWGDGSPTPIPPGDSNGLPPTP